MMQKEKTPQGASKKGNASIAVQLLITFIVIGIIAVAGYILAAQLQLTSNTVTNLVGTGTSTAYNNTTSAAGTMLSTAYQFGPLVIVSLLGGAALMALVAALWPLIAAFGGGAGGRRGM